MIYLDENVWRDCIKGWYITDCAVRERTIVYLCLRKKVSAKRAAEMWDSEIPSQVFVLNLAESGDWFSAIELEGWYAPLIGVARKPLRQGLLVDCNTNGTVSVMGGGKEFPNELIAPNRVPMTNRVKCINDYAYSVGSNRKIYKRTGIGKWELFAELTEKHYKGYTVSDYGFEDMDAFSETDMYAVGGRGDVWHFDGKIWVQQGFPSNEQLGTVTCAGDGYVYVSGEGGTIWRGRKSTWERIYQGDSSILWNDVLWFEDKLWLASDDQARIWDGKKLAPITHDGKEVYIYGHMDAYDGLLVISSPTTVKAYNGQKWRTLVAPYDLDDDDDDDDDDENDDDE